MEGLPQILFQSIYWRLSCNISMALGFCDKIDQSTLSRFNFSMCMAFLQYTSKYLAAKSSQNLLKKFLKTSALMKQSSSTPSKQYPRPRTLNTANTFSSRGAEGLPVQSGPSENHLFSPI